MEGSAKQLWVLLLILILDPIIANIDFVMPTGGMSGVGRECRLRTIDARSLSFESSLDDRGCI